MAAPFRPGPLKWTVLACAVVLALIDPVWSVVDPFPGPPGLLFPATALLLAALGWVAWPLWTGSDRR